MEGAEGQFILYIYHSANQLDIRFINIKRYCYSEKLLKLIILKLKIYEVFVFSSS